MKWFFVAFLTFLENDKVNDNLFVHCYLMAHIKNKCAMFPVDDPAKNLTTAEMR